MLNRLLEQRWPITAVLRDKMYTKIADVQVLKLRDKHWNLAAEVSPMFKPLQVATTVMSSKTQPSSSIYPIKYGLVHHHLAANDDDK